MSDNNGNAPTQSAPTALPPIPAILRGPVAIKIHNLDDSTPRSAMADATEALAKLEGKVVNLEGKDVAIDTKLFVVGQGNPTAGDRLNHSATVRFRPDLYRSVNDMPDENLLGCVAKELTDLNYCVRWSGSANNDRITLLNFEWRLDTSSVNLPLPLQEQDVKDGMTAILKQLEVIATNIVELRIDGTTVQGLVGLTDPNKTDMLVNKGALEFTDGRGAHATTPIEQRPKFKIAFYRHTSYVPVSYCTTLCLYIAGGVESDAELEADAKRIMAKVAEQFPEEGAWASGFTRSQDGMWFLMNPSRPRHALEATKIAAMNGFFYESAYLTNSSLANFRVETIRKARVAKEAELRRAQPNDNQADTDGRPGKRQRRGRSTFRDAFRNAAGGDIAPAQFSLTQGDLASTPAPAQQQHAPAPVATQTPMLVDEPIPAATPAASDASTAPPAGPSTPFPSQTPTTATGFAGLSIDPVAANAARSTRNAQTPNAPALGKRVRETSGNLRPPSTRPAA